MLNYYMNIHNQLSQGDLSLPVGASAYKKKLCYQHQFDTLLTCIEGSLTLLLVWNIYRIIANIENIAESDYPVCWESPKQRNYAAICIENVGNSSAWLV